MAEKVLTRVPSQTVSAAAPEAITEDSLLSKIGRTGLSGISKLGNLLDLPGSMVRDTLVWDNPFDQFLDPMSHYQTGRSATGRDVLSRNLLTGLVFTPNKETGISGWADDPMEGVQDLAGFATELATDPLAWMTGFTSKAPNAASKVLSAAAKTADVADAASDVAPLLQSVASASKSASPLKAASGVESAFRPGVAGKIDRVMTTLNKIDPGYHVGRKMKKVSDMYSLPEMVDKHITSHIVSQLNKHMPASLKPAKKSIAPIDPNQPVPKFDLERTPQQELNFLMTTGSAKPGSTIVTDLSPEMLLAQKVGNSFGAEVYFWSHPDGKSGQGAKGVRMLGTGNRVWVNEYAGPSAYINVVGHELIHLIRDTNENAFQEIVRIIEKNAPEGVLQKEVERYLRDYKTQTGRDLHPMFHTEEGAARTVQASFDRPAFWDELLASPILAPEIQKTFTQVMDTIKSRGTLTADEFKVFDENISAFLFAQRDTTAAGATVESLSQSRPHLFVRPDVTPTDSLLSALPPNSLAHRTIATLDDLGKRMNAGLQAAMNYKVRGHTHPVVQDFARKLTEGSEDLQPLINHPVMSLAETIEKMADSRKALDGFDRAGFMAQQQAAVRHAIEKNNFAKLDPELHNATKQLQVINQAFQSELLRAGLKRGELMDNYVEHYPRHLHPKISEALGEVPSSSLRPPGDLVVNNRASQSHRTMLFRDAYGGTDTFNAATVDHQALQFLTMRGVPKEERIVGAATHLRNKFISDIDPRIPVVRTSEGVDQLTLIRSNEDGSMSTVPVSFAELNSRYERIPSPHDLTTDTGRIAEHNEPVLYMTRSLDPNGNPVDETFELLTGRTDDRYDSLYRKPAEKRDRYEVMAQWMNDVGVNNLKETSGAFSGNALNAGIARLNQEVHTLQSLKHLPSLIISGLKSDLIKLPDNTPGVRQSGVMLQDVFNSEYFSRADKATIYQKVAHLDPHLQQLSTKMRADQFIKFMDEMRVDSALYKDLIAPGAFLKNTPPSIDDFLKLTRSSGALWKVGVLTHPARYTRDFVSGMAALIYSDRFSASAFLGGYEALFNRPSAELLNYPAVREYLTHGGLEHTPENATRAVRQMYASLKGGSSSLYRDVADEVSPLLDGQRGIETLTDPLPGDGRSGFGNMLSGAGNILRGREGGTWNPADVAGVQHIFEKTAKTPNGDKVIAKAGDVRSESEFIPVKAGNMVGKHTDDMNRLVGFVEGLRRGESPVDAYKAVNRIQLDYTGTKFAPLETKVLKKIFPFYSFMSRQTAFLATELMTNPSGKLGKMIRTLRNQEDPDENLPEHINEGVAIPLRTGEDGTKNYITGLGLMFEDPLKVAFPDSPQDLARNVLSRSAPTVKGLAELGLGRSAFQGGPLGGRDLADMDPVLGRIATQVGLQKELPGGQAKPLFGSRTLEFVASNSPASRILSSTKTLLDSRKNILERAANVTTGLRVTSVSPEQQRRGLRELTNAIAKELGSRSFETFHISQELLEDAKLNDPEKYETLLAIKELRRRWDADQRKKRKEKVLQKA